MSLIGWMDDAACRPDPRWTDATPSDAQLDRLGMECVPCPVRSECARYALDNEVEGGMYAGVWLPSSGRFGRNKERTDNVAWVEAREALRRQLRVSA